VISRRFSVWQKVVALAPLLLLAVYLPGEMMLRCRIDGLLRPACCCPHAAEPAQESGPVAKAQDCCAREMSTNDRPVVEAAQLSGPDQSQSSISTAFAAPTLVLSSSTLAGSAQPRQGWPSQGPPREGRPIVLLKHAFLI
jgi:hypothetical protein